MSPFSFTSRVFFLACLLVTATSSFVFAEGKDEVKSKLQTAWEKFSEMQEVLSTYGARAEVALATHQKERYRADVLATIQTLQAQVDGFPPNRYHWSSFQEEAYQGLLAYRQELAGTERALAESRLQMEQLNQQALSDAARSGKRVKPLDLPSLLTDLQRLDRERLDAFSAAKKAITDAAIARKLPHTQIYRNAMNELVCSIQPPSRLCQQTQFCVSFEQFCGGNGFFKWKQQDSRRGTGKTKTARGSSTGDRQLQANSR